MVCAVPEAGVPITLAVKLCVAVPLATVSVNVVVPAPERDVGTNAPVTPVGNPVTENVTVEENDPLTVSVMTSGALAPGAIVNDGLAADNMNPVALTNAVQVRFLNKASLNAPGEFPSANEVNKLARVCVVHPVPPDPMTVPPM